MSEHASSVLELRDVKVRRGGVEVLDVPSLHLHEREFVSLIGPNGSGKSTLLLSMMGLLGRAGGEMLYRGAAVGTGRAMIAYRRTMALVLQETCLFDVSVYENVASGLRIRRLGRADVRRRTTAYLERFRLAGMADRSARKLSGGEARRVNLARALVAEPEVLLLDEPFTGLDPPTRRSIVDDLERTLREAGTAAILVTHDQPEALRLSDRIVVMERGRVVQSNVPSVVMREPVNAFVASWVGMESILEGVIRRSTGSGVVVSVGGREIESVGEGSPGERVYCCIRPESVLLEVVNPLSTTSARNVFPARIESATDAGPVLTLRLDCGFPLVAHVTRESFVALDLARREDVFASFKATAIHLIRRGECAPPRGLPC
jgi:tungstate transport system ATP-binding protein